MAPRKDSTFLRKQESTYNGKAIFKRFRSGSEAGMTGAGMTGAGMTIVSFRRLSKIPL